MRIAVAGPVDLLAIEWPLGRPGRLPLAYSAPVISHLANALLRRGHEVVLVTCSEDVDAPLTFRSEPLTVVVCRRRRRHRARDLFALERAEVAAALRRHDCDVVHAQWTYEFAWAALESGRPAVVSVHDDAMLVLRLSPDPYRLARWLMDRRTLATAPCLVANSDYLRARLPRWARRRTAVVPNLFDPAVPALAGTVTRRPLTVVTVSNGFSRWKNLAAALEALARVRRELPAVSYRVIGTGMEAGGPAATYAASRGLDAGVTFLGPLPYEDTLREIAGAALYLHPSLEESFGMTILEAMLLGTPVVAGRDSGNVPDLLAGGRCGTLCDVSDPDDIAAALLRALTDPVGPARLAAEARREARLRFAPEAVVPLWEAVYEHVLATWPRRSRGGTP